VDGVQDLFLVQDAGRRKMHGGYRYADYWHPVDHPEWYRKDKWPVAIVGHNYGGAFEDHTLIDLAIRGGLILHVPPAGTAASWYFPGSTVLLVLTRPKSLGDRLAHGRGDGGDGG
jgi:hypothetical protein